MKKMETIAKNLPKPEILGVKPEEADFTIISWGSNKGIIKDVIKRMPEMKICFVHTVYVWPFPTEFISDVLNKSKVTILAEQNYDAQFGQLIRQYCLKDVDLKILRYDGRPLDSVEIVQDINNFLRK